jgi:uncharacterized protein (UPF0276 family)
MYLKLHERIRETLLEQRLTHSMLAPLRADRRLRRHEIAPDPGGMAAPAGHTSLLSARYRPGISRRGVWRATILAARAALGAPAHEGRAMTISTCPVASAGIGLRLPHLAGLLATREPVGFLEVDPEAFLGTSGEQRRQLLRLRERYPLTLHGLGLPLGCPVPPDEGHLGRLDALIGTIEPVRVSGRLAWGGRQGLVPGGLIPTPFTEETLRTAARNVAIVQDRLQRQVLVENVAAHFRWPRSTMAEPDFMVELARITGCGVLLDMGSVYVGTANVGGDPYRWLSALSPAMVGEIRLAGHSAVEVDGAELLIADRTGPVPEGVWRLYAAVVRRFPQAPALVERNGDLPALEVLLGEAARADEVRAMTLGEGRRRAA